MTTFDDRERSYEAKFARDADLQFKAEARRNRLLGEWAAEVLGKTGEDAKAYSLSVVTSDFEEPGDEDVFRKVAGDLEGKADEATIRAMRFNHCGSFLVSSDDTGIIKYFQPNMNNVAAWQAHREAVRGLSFSPDDARFVSASDDSKLKLWSFEDMREERTFTGTSNRFMDENVH